ncbi:DUF1654 domain-containing protein [Pseudomonas viridiflava]|uniref:DUF1654 domain-containing protein n=1 Tax=Pseudomonas viridiflava TaxID=33069 RepID=UPI000F063C67|nr:DUF1654 domain-containing protein [Pseudomonas viridiflava]
MSKTQPRALVPPTSLEMLGARIQKILTSPAARKEHAALVYKAPDESQEDWDQIMDAITETDGVYAALQDDGSVRVFWDVPAQD